MRALFKTLLGALCITMLWNVGDVLIGSRKFLDHPRIHVVQDGEYFSKLAEQYYGNAEYWRALALINRAPNVDKIYPGEHIILPDAGTVARIARARKLSDVNELVSNQQALAALESQQEALEFSKDFGEIAEDPMPAIETALLSSEEALESAELESAATELVEPIQETKNSDDMGAYDAFVATQQAGGSEQSTASNKFWPLAGVTATLLFGVVILYRRKKKNRIDEPEIDASPLKSFILEDEQNEEKSDNSVDSIPSSYSDDIFKPVRRQHEDSREKEVAYTVQEG